MAKSKAKVLQHPSNGVLLVCFGKREYYWAAYNLAFTIKEKNPDTYIRLVCDDTSLRQLHVHHRYVFDDVIEIGFKFNEPADIKLNLDKWMHGKDTWAYLDIDAIALNDISKIFEMDKDVSIACIDTHTIDKGRDIKTMQWAWGDDIWNQYDLKKDFVLPVINSSILIFKTDYAIKLFSKARELFANRIPLENLRSKWGGSQPDELYLNIALGLIGGYETNDFVCFRTKKISGETWEHVKTKHYFMSYYGGKRFLSEFYIDSMDSHLHKLHLAKRENSIYKIHNIIKNKHANN